MMEISKLKKRQKMEVNIIKYVRNRFKLKQQIGDSTVKDIRNFFRPNSKMKKLKI